MKSARSGPLSAPETLRGPRWREFHCLAALRRLLYMTRRAVVSRVISTPRCLAVFVANMGFGRGAHVWLKFSESVNSFGVFVFFPRFVGIWLSNGVVKSKNKFAQPKIECTKGSGSWSRNFEKSRFS